VRVLNSLMEALRLDQSSFERLVAKVMAVPAKRFLRSRRVSFLAACDADHRAAQVLRGAYQSPISCNGSRPNARNAPRHFDRPAVLIATLA